MRDNGPLTGKVLDLRDAAVIVSRTDLKGVIVYANADFLEVSGFDESEVLGQSHNIVRHPDMPASVFADMWADLKSGRSWIGVIKNRCKNGDAYWVEAHVSPVWEKGEVTGFLSMRRKPRSAQIDRAEALYAKIRQGGHADFVFRHGRAEATGMLAGLKERFADTRIALKFLLCSLAAALAVLGLFVHQLASGVSGVLDQEARDRLRHDVGLVSAAVAAGIDGARREIIAQSRTFSERLVRDLGGRLHIGRASLEALTVREPAGRENPIDHFLHELTGVATVFVRTPQGFQRRMTTLKDESGALAVGTYLPEDHPALIYLQAGQPYIGPYKLFGRTYLGCFTPILTRFGEVVGASLIAVDLANQLEFLKAQIRPAKVGLTGYYYIVDATPGEDYGRLVLHPFKEKQKIIGTMVRDGQDLTDEMLRRRQGEIVYPWMNAEAGETRAREKLVIFETLEQPQWIVAGGSSLDEFTMLSDRIAWRVIWGGLAIAATIFLITFLLLRKLILQPLNNQVLPAFRSMSAGGFETQLDLGGDDEVGRIIQGLESLQNRLAFESEHTRALSEARELARQAAEDLSRARSEFLANMSHEIRTPMNAVISLSYLLQQGELGDRERNYVRRIESAGRLLLGIVNDILDLSKIDAGKMQLEAAPFHLDDVLDNVSSVMRDRVQEKNLTLEYVISPEVPPTLLGDSLRLSQILINLVGNAIKFTAHGAVIVFVTTENVDATLVRLQFRVQDTGIGMTPEQASRLFQPFSQGDTSITRKFGGTGLGLTICKRLVDLMGGTIWVDSQSQVGSVFSFNVQLEIGAGTAVVRHGAGRRCLVVDDSQLSRTVVSRLLQNYGCLVQTADSGEAALAAMRCTGAPEFDFVFLDLHMPNMDGLSLAHNIREHEGARVKLVLVTMSNVHAGDYQNSLAAFDAMLEKPVTAAMIGTVLADLSGSNSGHTAPTLPAPASGSAALAGLRLLVMEDHPTNQLIIRDLLESMGATVEIADNGAVGLKALAALGDRVDMVLMDVQMPVMDGLEATRCIRSESGHRDMPVIALTAHALEEERERCSAAGMNDFLTKPIEPAQLVSVLLRWRPPAMLPAAPAPVARTVEPVALPEPFMTLPGIDTAAGLHRMLDRVPLYQKVLRDFHTRFLGETDRIRTALGGSTLDEALRLAHSLKGLSATIGADSLSAAARALELAIKERGTAVEPELDEVSRELGVVLDGIRNGFHLDPG